MANEITVTCNLSFAKSDRGASAGTPAAGLQFSVTGTKYTATIQSIGTSEEAIDLGEIGTVGWCFFKNLDATNFIKIRSITGTAGSSGVKLKAGECAIFRAGVAALYAISDTAACEMQTLMIED